MMADALNRSRGPALAPAYWAGRRIAGASLEQSYRNTIHCCEALRQEGGKISGHYCGNRWCLVCASIRTGRAFNNYMPILRTWRAKQFVTLTLQNVGPDQLRGTIGEMIWALTLIKKTIRQRYGVTLVGIRKLECTYNAERGDYHPHFHLVIEDMPTACLVVMLWLDVWGGLASSSAQKIVAGRDGTAAEMFKYFTKLVTKRKMMAPPVLDTIFRAMRRRQVFRSFGFTLANDDDESDEITFDRGTYAPSRRDESIVWDWNERLFDWVDLATGECLTDYEPAVKFREFVESIG